MMITNEGGKRAVDCTTSTELKLLLKKEAGTHKIMISYTHSHAHFAARVRKYLESQEQLTCWMYTMDPSGIGGGDVWREEIARGITNCSLVLSIVCHGYTKSEWCLKEQALDKLLRKSLLGLIFEEGHPEAMESLEREENPRSVVFEIDDAAFTRRWQSIRPRLMSNLQDGAANVLIPEPAATFKRNKLLSLTIECVNAFVKLKNCSSIATIKFNINVRLLNARDSIDLLI
ncbi:hypothetical protein PsorP6_018147 [Peronosclerospora sorghi]|uniref:Uncharacterized protein n=1 Tax=Peronosclerospora sorghi TaxID=230839 RepID=A0ACC0WC73_9STRA|nr:hypothetical protein PsorP6_018147 [Peronosclerospora sorghi]